MDPKQIAFGAAVVVLATVGGGVAGYQKDKAQVVAASEKAVDIAAAQVASVGDSEVKTCELVRVGTKDGVILQWACGGAVMPQATQQELNKLAGEKGSRIEFTPRDDKGVTVLDARVFEGEKPNTDPIPVMAEAAPAPKQEEPVGEVVP